MISADQLVIHAVGDYVVQSHWMATEKVKRWTPALIHATTYGLGFLFLTRSLLALAVIVGTHALIDRFRLARHVTWLKNQAAPQRTPRTPTGYPVDTPPWLAVWLLIIADNIMHVLINGAALRWLA